MPREPHYFPSAPVPSPWSPVSLAKRHHHGVVLDATEQTPLLQCSQHCLPSLKPGQALNGNGLITAMPK